MKSVGILTLHFSNNHGAVLQAYALYNVVRLLGEHSVRIMPFCRIDGLKYYYGKDEARAYLQDLKMQKLRNFLIEHCHLNDRDCSDLSDYEPLDYYISGSDQIWNRSWGATQGTEYFLSFVSSGKRIAYAPSVGLPISKISQETLAIMREYLPQYDNLSVREQEHQKLIEDISGKPCPVVLDPTLLLDASDYASLISNREKDGPFIFLMWLHDDHYRGMECANMLSAKTGYRIVHSKPEIAGPMLFNDGGCMYYEGVEEFLWCIKNAEMVITDSFHATVFSILFHRPFYSFMQPSMRSRFDSLLPMLGHDDRKVETFIHVSDMTFDIDFSETDAKIREMRRDSLDYLKTALGVQDDGTDDR